MSDEGPASSVEEQVREVRSSVGLWRLASRGLLRVSGEDRVRWLNGMLSNDVAALTAETASSGCYATLLTPQGRIVADLHVLLRPEGFWLELPRSAVDAVMARLERYIIADDVVLEDCSDAVGRLSVEGPGAAELLAQVGDAAGSLADLGPDCGTEIGIAGHRVVVASFGWTGERAFQLFVPDGATESVAAVIEAAGRSARLVSAEPEALEILRIEAGVPRLGPELDEEVLPDEARLGRAISESKGCYTGQEIVARLRSQGRVSHLLVGLRFESGTLPRAEAALQVGSRRVGEVTSVCHSPHAGDIGLGYVRRAHAEPGTELEVGSGRARVASLPIVAPSGETGTPASSKEL